MFDEENPTGGEQLQPEGEKKEENKEENKEEKKEEGSKVEPGEQGETEEEVNPIKEARFEKAFAEYEAAQKAYTDALRDSKYVKEICEADLDIISVSRTIEKKRYDTENAELNESLKELTEAGAGVDVSYTATHSGKSGKTNLATNKIFYKGQYLFTVIFEGKKLLRA